MSSKKSMVLINLCALNMSSVQNTSQLHQCRITATKSEVSVKYYVQIGRLLNKIVWGHRLIQTVATKYSCDKETVAMNEYKRLKSEQLKILTRKKKASG